MRRFRVDRVPRPGERVTLDAAASHHLLVVCRMPRGARLVVFDGAGVQAEVQLADGAGAAEVLGLSDPTRAAPTLPLHLVLALPKGPALDTALRMAVELGVTHLHPVISERTVPKGDRADRWERILASAAAQCGRADLPELTPLRPLDEAARSLPGSLDRRVAVPGAPAAERATGGAALAIGPEGGWSPAELDRLCKAGWTPIGLGSWVLRVDTAVAVGLGATAARD